MNNKKSLKGKLGLAATALLLIALAAAFWPRAAKVDMAVVGYRPLFESVSEQGRTQVRNAYQISSPLAGHMERVRLEAGDTVKAGDTVALIYPTMVRLLDEREYAQARAALDTALAAKAMGEARLKQAYTDLALARDERKRLTELFADGSASTAEKDRAERDFTDAELEVNAQEAAMSMHDAQIATAQSQLERFEQIPHNSEPFVVRSPIDGVVLKVLQKSEQHIQAGAVLLEMANLASELEVLVELLTSDAVKVSPGSKVDIDDWGGDTLSGEVDRIEPGGYIKYSALGVEEQRVKVFVRFTGDPQLRQRLGDGFRVDCTIYTWQSERVLSVPVSALFRTGEDWATYRVNGARVELTKVRVGHKNAYYAEVLSGLSDGDSVVLYPDPDLQPGDRVSPRDEASDGKFNVRESF